MKAIFLDFYGTVVHEDGKVISAICERIQRSLYTSISISEIADDWWKEFYRLFVHSYEENFQTQRELEVISLQNILHKFNSPENVFELSEFMFQHWKRPEIFPDALEFLNSNQLPIYILSNIDRSDVLEAIHYHQIEVEEVITSEDVMSYKPRPEMFLHALQVSGLKTEEVIHAGDSLSSDIRGAAKVNMKNVWINRSNKEFNGDIHPTYIIQNLTELTRITGQI